MESRAPRGRVGAATQRGLALAPAGSLMAGITASISCRRRNATLIVPYALAARARARQRSIAVDMALAMQLALGRPATTLAAYVTTAGLGASAAIQCQPPPPLRSSRATTSRRRHAPVAMKTIAWMIASGGTVPAITEWIAGRDLPPLAPSAVMNSIAMVSAIGAQAPLRAWRLRIPALPTHVA